MDKKLKDLSNELRLSDEARVNIRANIAAYQPESERDKSVSFVARAPLLAAVIAVMALMVTAGAAVAMTFQNDIIVSSRDEVFAALEKQGEGGAVAIVSPSGSKTPSTLEEITQNDRLKSDDWEKGVQINGGVTSEYFKWDTVQVLNDDPALRSRLITRSDGAAKMEYTAENPQNLLKMLTGRVAIKLDWIDRHYCYVPDANVAYTITDEKDNFVGEIFRALYAGDDGKSWFRVCLTNTAEEMPSDKTFIVDGSYETAYYYTSADGYEFLIKMNNGLVWVDCNMSRTSVGLFGAYLSREEVEDILDNLSLSLQK